MTSTLGTRSVRGVAWSIASQVGRVAIRSVTLIVLARLVGPEAFGVMSMVIVVTGFIDLFNDLGTSAAIIQRREISERLLSTLFWTNLMFGAAFAVATFFAAPLVADFYNEPQVTAVLQVMSASFILASLRLVQEARFMRALNFRVIARAEIAGASAGAVTGIAAAAAGAGVFSLVAYTLANVGTISLLLWIQSSWRPSFLWDLDELRSVFAFSSSIVGFNFVNYCARNADYLLIGRFLGATALGYYSLAYQLILFPIQLVTSAVGRVSFPAYSEVQTDNARLGRMYLRVARGTALIAFPMMLGLLVVCDVFVDAVYGDAWQEAVPVLAILAPVGLFQAIASSNGSVYRAKGRAGLQLRVGLVFSLIYVGSIALGLQWGIVGVAACYAVANLLVVGYPAFRIPLGLIDLPVKDLVRDMARPLAASVLMLAAVGGLRALVPLQGVAGLIGLIAFGILAYVLATLAVNRAQASELVKTLRTAAA